MEAELPVVGRRERELWKRLRRTEGMAARREVDVDVVWVVEVVVVGGCGCGRVGGMSCC